MRIKNIKWIVGGILLICALFLGTYHLKAQEITGPENPPIPTVTGMVVNDGEGLSAYINWTFEPGMYGSIIKKKGVKGEEIALDTENYPVGFDNESNGGWYFDSAVVPGDTYTYTVNSYDRGGLESTPAEVTLKVEGGKAFNHLFLPNKLPVGSTNYLTWSKPCQCDGNFEYEVIRDGESIAKTTNTFYVDNNTISIAGSLNDYLILAYKL